MFLCLDPAQLVQELGKLPEGRLVGSSLVNQILQMPGVQG